MFDGHKFNRGVALNAASSYAGEHSYVVLHDVDLVPSRAHFARAYLPLWRAPRDPHAVHLASAWPQYSYETFLGGALAVSRPLWERAGRMPQRFFGWGGEDDAFRNRLLRFERETGERVEWTRFAKDAGAYTDLEREPGFGTREFKRVTDRARWQNTSKSEDIREDASGEFSDRVLLLDVRRGELLGAAHVQFGIA